MPIFVDNIEELTLGNSNFRQVLSTNEHSQLVIMSLKPGEEIGMEIHGDVDQFFRIDAGEGKLVAEGQEYSITDGFAIVIPAGTEHNIINTSETEDLKLYTVYSPANHPDGTIHETKTEADEYEKSHHHD
ncbi:cupin domain-containing protein [Patescibacteria group bacterium]|nr:cupin domain-containing protein [Patescibacteria group bacterium]